MTNNLSSPDENLAFVLNAIQDDYRVLANASPALRNDKTFMSAAVNIHTDALKYASDSLKNDPIFISSILNKDGWALEHVSDTLKNNKNIVAIAIKEHPHALRFASDNLKNDKDTVLSAVTQHGGTLKYASNYLKDDFEVVLEAMRIYHALEYTSERLKTDQRILFMESTDCSIPDTDWSLVKKVLLEKPDYFLNPEPYMQALADGMNNPYLMLAQYALGKDIIIKSEAYPELN